VASDAVLPSQVTSPASGENVGVVGHCETFAIWVIGAPVSNHRIPQNSIEKLERYFCQLVPQGVANDRRDGQIVK
jgi:hypothetical protein